jgi:hypothetical protein
LNEIAPPRQLHRYIASLMKSSKFWIPLVVSLFLTPVFLFLGLVSGGAGHGEYVLARILFPFTMLSTRIFGSIVTPFIVLAIIQFPLYGLVLGTANVRRKMLVFSAGLVVLHSLSAALCFFVVGENFS